MNQILRKCYSTQNIADLEIYLFNYTGHFVDSYSGPKNKDRMWNNEIPLLMSNVYSQETTKLYKWFLSHYWQ